MTQGRPDVDAVLAGLKDFQRDSVEYVFDRLYGADPTHRFLVADEVGLGKTLVARGLIAKAIDRLWDATERIDIIYICSNGDIARQNIRRLDITGGEAALPSRVTLLPREIGNLKENRLNFVALTPGTSFDLKTQSGMWQERALLYWLLDMAGWSTGRAGAKNVLQGGVQNTRWFRDEIQDLPTKYTIDPTLAEAFAHALDLRVHQQKASDEPDLRSRYDDLCSRFQRTRRNLPEQDRIDRRAMVGELRSILAASCLEALEPDLVILDEFQRFKDLLRPDDEAGLLAQRLFEYEQADERARVILLSATPYKMYTLAQESASDDHYRDFVDTLRFLLNDEAKVAQLADTLESYREGVYRLSEDGGNSLRVAKAALERSLRRVMVRTERLAVSSDRDGMLREITGTAAPLLGSDVGAFVQLQRVGAAIDQPDGLEFWKSAPYLLNFMDGYRFKKEFVKWSDDRSVAPELAAPLLAGSSLLLPWADVTAYRQIDPGNARLRGLFQQVIDSGAWKLLWIPPSMPHYELGGPFADPSLRSMTKHLIFSSWVMVPRVIACLVSYEAERRMIRSQDRRARNTPAARNRRRGLLQFTKSDGRLTGMPVLAMLYPSISLADLGDPRTIAAERGAPSTLNDALAAARGRIEGPLASVLKTAPTDGPEDEQWYWAAPILMDRNVHRARTERWFLEPNLAEVWIGADPGGDDSGTGWADHVEQARLTAGGAVPSGRPPSDLPDVLALMAVAGPGTCALRALRSQIGQKKGERELHARDAAAEIAWGFRTLFNQPEAMGLIRGLSDSDRPYWQQVLAYCAEGGLQAVLDEYAHFLFESLGLDGRGPEEVMEAMAEAMVAPLQLRTPTLRLDEVRVSPEGSVEVERGRGMRGRFALRFGADPVEGSNEPTREDHVRQAFNSPFAPFVLATTSVGQEGLDFHAYCHSVIHWNLPSNPVDLEQREGRVHRYKGHAVRKNVAADHGVAALASEEVDAWTHAFEAARDPQQSDLVPFWVYQGDAKIERRVPSLPLSRERDRLEALRRSLALYRLVFGQPRQDDLIAFLLTQVPHSEIDRHLQDLRIRLDPPPTGGQGR